MGSYSDWLTGANNSQNPAGASRDLTNYYGAYAMPAPAAAAPTTVAQPAPVVTPISTPAAISTTNNAANGGTTTGAYQLPDVVAPTSTPALDTTQDTTTVNPTPKTPTLLCRNTAPTAATGKDQTTTTVKPLKTPSTTERVVRIRVMLAIPITPTRVTKHWRLRRVQPGRYTAQPTLGRYPGAAASGLRRRSDRAAGERCDGQRAVWS